MSKLNLNKLESENESLVFSKINYLIMFAGIALIGLGFIVMKLDTEEYGFGFMGITLGPLMVLSGFVVEVIAILYKGKQK